MQVPDQGNAERLAALGRLAAGVAHEINNPLGFVRANIETLTDYTETLIGLVSRYQAVCEGLSGVGGVNQDGLDDISRIWDSEDVPFILEDAGEMLRETMDGADRASEIVAALKTFARGETSGTEPVDVAKCAHSALLIVNNELKYHCTVVKQLEKGQVVEANFGKLNDVIVGLLLNAGQAVKGSGTVTIASTAGDRDILLSVSDTGVGMAPDVLGRVFEPFYTTRGVAGKGLGLAVAKQTIESFGGSLELESMLGQGTTVTIRLPRRV